MSKKYKPKRRYDLETTLDTLNNWKLLEIECTVRTISEANAMRTEYQLIKRRFKIETHIALAIACAGFIKNRRIDQTTAVTLLQIYEGMIASNELTTHHTYYLYGRFRGKGKNEIYPNLWPHLVICPRSVHQRDFHDFDEAQNRALGTSIRRENSRIAAGTTLRKIVRVPQSCYHFPKSYLTRLFDDREVHTIQEIFNYANTILTRHPCHSMGRKALLTDAQAARRVEKAQIRLGSHSNQLGSTPTARALLRLVHTSCAQTI